MVYIDVGKLLKFLCDKGIDANALVICLILLDKKDENIIKYKKEYKYLILPDKLKELSENSSLSSKVKITDYMTREYIDKLEELGYVNNHSYQKDNIRHYTIDSLMLTPKFTNEFGRTDDSSNSDNDGYVDSKTCAEELFDAYPKTIKVKERILPARNVPEEYLQEYYFKAIKASLSLHRKIVHTLNAVSQSKNRKQQFQIGLKSFVDKRYWEVIFEDPKIVGLKSNFYSSDNDNNDNGNDDYGDSSDLIHHV